MPDLAAGNGPIRALLGDGSGVGAAVALYQHAISGVPLEVCLLPCLLVSLLLLPLIRSLLSFSSFLPILCLVLLFSVQVEG